MKRTQKHQKIIWQGAIVAIFALMVAGCTMARIRTKAIGLSESDIKNKDTVHAVVANLDRTWPTWSGVIRGRWGEQLDEVFPPRAVKAMDFLDEIAIAHDYTHIREMLPESIRDKPLENGPFDDFKIGASAGLRLRVGEEVIVLAVEEIIEAIEKIAPDLWPQLLKVLF